MRIKVLLLFIGGLLAAVPARSQPTCVAPALTEQQVKDSVEQQRSARSDLPRPYPESRWEVRRDGCHYTFIEYGIPGAPDYFRIFKLNQRGVIVDAPQMSCPAQVLSETDLAEIVRKARAERRDLPLPFASQRTRVSRLRCLYQYFEYNQPDRRGDYQVFTIDPFGELMSFTRSDPY